MFADGCRSSFQVMGFSAESQYHRTLYTWLAKLGRTGSGHMGFSEARIPERDPLVELA